MTAFSKILEMVPIVVGGVSVAAPLVAQVGHPPESSPYRDLLAAYMVTVGGSYVAGGRGTAGVGPSDGRVGGLQLDFRLAGPSHATLGLYGGNFERLVIDPTRGVGDRVRDTVTQSMMIVDAGFNFVLTGKKTWRGFAPYAGGALGAALGGEVPQDTVSGFVFSSKFHLSPRIGVRFHPSQRVNLRLEVRDLIWRLSYPPGFFDPPFNAPGDPPVLDSRVTKRTEWAHHAMLSLSVGYAVKLAR